MPRSGSQWLHKLLWRLYEAGVLRMMQAHNHNHYGAGNNAPRPITGWPTLGIYRDIRDVIVSAYYLNERRKEVGKGAHPWINALTEGKSPAEGIHAMCLDQEHAILDSYLGWFRSYWGQPHVLLLRFEDTVHRRYAVYEALAGLGFAVPQETYDAAWDALDWKRMAKAHPEHYRTRGQSTWERTLVPETVRLIEEKCGWFFERTEYPLWWKGDSA